MRLELDGVAIRSMEMDDADILYRWENDASLWSVSDTVSPFSKEALKLFIESSFQEVPKDQLRLMIDYKGQTVGCVDLFEISHVNHHASIGVLLYDSSSRNRGIASKAIALVEQLAYQSLEIRSIKAEVSADNTTAISFFEKLGYTKIGTLKDWKRVEFNLFSDVHVFQHIL